MKTYKKGISLIVLVITILVLAILATTVIVSLSNTNIINEANAAVIKNRFQSMQQQLDLYIADQYAVTKGTFKLEDLDAGAKSSTIDTIFPELKDTKYYDYVSLVDGNIVLADNMPDREIAISVTGGVNTETTVTNYTQADIDASNGKLVAIGANNSLNVVAKISDDGETITITKNGADSDGVMLSVAPEKDWEYVSDFAEYTSLKKLIIKEGVTNIGKYMFKGCSMTEIVLPSSITTISEYAFFNCTNLSGNLIIPDGMTYIYGMAFYETAITSVTIPHSVTRIEEKALPESVTSITYMGTIEEWDSIDGIRFNPDGTHYGIVHCTDGDTNASEI